MTDVLFVTPNFNRTPLDESNGTALLATILQQNGIQAEIMPFAIFGDPHCFESFLQSAIEKICSAGAKVISFYTRCDTYHIVLTIAERLKRQTDAFIVFGGPQSDIAATDTMREIPYVDFICCGEGETTVYPFFASLLRGEPDTTVPGLVYRADGNIIHNPRPAFLSDLDTLPMVDYSLWGYETRISKADAFPIDVGRGCPFSCTYCSTKTFWGRKYRLKSPQRIFTEIRLLHEQYGVTYFAFEHDMFTMNRKQVIETCQLLQTLDFPVSWRCSARIDCIDNELIDIMAASGMKSMFIGIETGSPRMQKIISKNLNLEGIVDKLKYLHAKGISLTTSFIYGFPQETEDDISQTLTLIAEIAEISAITIGTYRCTFLPGTELTTQYRDQLIPAAKPTEISNAPAMEACMDLIRSHPRVFVHMWDYPSELRAKLAHFTVFVKTWTLLQPVYQYIRTLYSDNRLLDMYFDFCEANRVILQKNQDLPTSEQVRGIIESDNFSKQYLDTPYGDIIADYCRMTALLYSGDLLPGKSVTDVFCFSPHELKRGVSLQQIVKKLSVVSLATQPDGKKTIRVRTMHKN